MEKNKRKNNILMQGLQVHGRDQEMKTKAKRFIKDNPNVTCETGKRTKIFEK